MCTSILTLTESLIHTHTFTGAVGATFAAGACTSASIRDKDDYVNAAVGGMLAGSIFGFKRTFNHVLHIFHNIWLISLVDLSLS